MYQSTRPSPLTLAARTPQLTLLRVEQVAVILGIGRSKAYELVRDGTLPSVKIGKAVRVAVPALKAYLTRLTGMEIGVSPRDTDWPFSDAMTTE